MRKPMQESKTMNTLSSRNSGLSLACALALALGLSATPVAPVGAQATAQKTAQKSATTPGTSKTWTVPRTPDGKPDLQGNWTNETQTPFERMGNQGPTLTDAQAAALEKRAKDVEEFRDRPTDP